MLPSQMGPQRLSYQLGYNYWQELISILVWEYVATNLHCIKWVPNVHLSQILVQL